MAKLIASFMAPQVDIDGNLFVGYMVAVVDGAKVFSYGADYKVDTTITVASNIIAWKNKVIAEVASNGTTIVSTDIIMFGGPA